MAEADDARFAAILAAVLDLESETSKDSSSVLEIEASLIQRLLPLGLIVAKAHRLL